MLNEDLTNHLSKVRWYASLSFKLFMLMTTFLFLCVGAVTWQQLGVLSDYLHRQLEDTTQSKAAETASETKNSIKHWENTLNLVATHMAGSTTQAYADFVSSFISSDRAIVTFDLFELKSTGKLKQIITTSNPYASIQRSEQLTELRKKSTEIAQSSSLRDQMGGVEIVNLEPMTKLPLIGLAKVFKIQGQSSQIVAILTLERQAIFAQDLDGQAIKVLFLKKSGDILIQLGDQSFSINPFFEKIKKKIFDDKIIKGLMTEQPTNSDQFYVALDEVSGYGLHIAVVQNASGAKMAIRKTLVHTLIWVWLAVLSAIFVSYWAAFSMTHSLKRTTVVTEKIANGDFESKVDIRGRDEVASLAASINSMTGRIRNLLIAQVEAAKKEKEIETARIVQESFFPKGTWTSPTIRIIGQCFPASGCGGDLWGHFPIMDRWHYFFVADAIGHGVSAALVTAMAYAQWQSLAAEMKEGEKIHSPATILKLINRGLTNEGKSEATMTMFVALIDLKAGTIIAANAGHNLPFLIRAERERSEDERKAKSPESDPPRYEPTLQKFKCAGLPLGFHEDVDYAMQTLTLHPGDKIFAYTDGLFECRGPNGKSWGEKMLRKSIKMSAHQKADLIKNHVSGEAFHHFGHVPRDDDVTIVVVEMGETRMTQSPDGETRARMAS